MTKWEIKLRQFDVLVVGSGHAGAQAAIVLRQVGFAGTLAIIGEEPELPYARPPLSKDYLAGDKAFERILIRPERFWAERGITLIQGERVVLREHMDWRALAIASREDGDVCRRTG